MIAHCTYWVNRMKAIVRIESITYLKSYAYCVPSFIAFPAIKLSSFSIVALCYLYNICCRLYRYCSNSFIIVIIIIISVSTVHTVVEQASIDRSIVIKR